MTATATHSPDLATKELLGCSVEHQDGDDATGGTMRAAYILTGKRGAVFALLRNLHRPWLMFVCNPNSLSNSKVRGYRWFSDQSGTLEPFS